MAYVDRGVCERLGLDPKVVEAIARRISRATEDANRLGLRVFAIGSGSGALTMNDGSSREHHVASLDGSYEGGDPDWVPDEM